MRQRPLGTSGLTISTVGLGSWAIGGEMWGGQDDAQSVDAIHAAVDHGVNWIDTAPIYGSTHAETIIGRALAALPASARPRVFTKFGVGTDLKAYRRSASAAQVVDECEGSLRRLGVDQIDLYQLHWPAPQPIAETAEACDRLLRAGKIRAIGVSNYSVGQLDEWLATGVPLHSVQPPFSILRPAAKETVMPWCHAHQVGVISYSPLLRGMLFGTWGRDKTFKADDDRSNHKDYKGPRFQRHLDAIDEVRVLANRAGLSTAQLCVAMLLREPGLTGIIAGARDARQGSVIAGLGVEISDDLARAVWAIAGRLATDLETIPAVS